MCPFQGDGVVLGRGHTAEVYRARRLPSTSAAPGPVDVGDCADWLRSFQIQQETERKERLLRVG